MCRGGVVRPELDVPELEGGARPAIGALRALVRVVERGAAEASQVVREHCHAPAGPHCVDLVVARDVVSEAVQVQRDGLWGRCGPGPRVELRPVEAGQPGLGACRGREHV